MDKNDKEELEMCRILIFSGTTEGNQIAKAVCRLPAKVYVSVATEYGKVCAEEQSEAEIIAGRMYREEIQEFLNLYKIDIVIDATHPFARVVTENIQKACENGKIKYIRCVREAENEAFENENCVWAENVDKAVSYLQETKGNI